MDIIRTASNFEVSSSFSLERRWLLIEKNSGNPDALSYLSSLQPPKRYSSRVGPGGPLREHGHPKPIPLPMDDRYEEVKNDGKFSTQISLLQDHVRSSLSTATELQRSSSPSHLILPHVMSAVQLSSELGMWRLYRFGVVVLAEVMLGMEAVPLSKKAIQEIESVWPQVGLMDFFIFIFFGGEISQQVLAHCIRGLRGPGEGGTSHSQRIH